MQSVTVQVKVSVEEDASEPSGFRFVSLKVGDGQPIPLPKDAPAPRRLGRDLAAAAAAALQGKPSE